MPTFIIPYNGGDHKIHESITYVTPENIDNINTWIKDIRLLNVVDDDWTMNIGKLQKEVKVKSSINQKTYTYVIGTPVKIFIKKDETKLVLPSLPEDSFKGGRRQTNRKMRKNRRNKTRK